MTARRSLLGLLLTALVLVAALLPGVSVAAPDTAQDASAAKGMAGADGHSAAAGTFASVMERGGLPLPGSLWAGGASQVHGRLGIRVAMRKVKYARTLVEAPLPLPPVQALSPTSAPMQEQAGTSALWPVGLAVRETLLAPSPQLAEKGASLDIHGFNEVRLDSLTASLDNPGRLAFKAELAGGQAVFVSDPLETVGRLTPGWADGSGRDAVAVAGGRWAEKSLRYLAARFLNRDPDDVWRYAQDGLSTFVQRRFRKDLTDVGAIDVVLLRGQDVQVNLVVALDPSKPKARTVLDWYAMEKRFFDLGDGRRILRLYLGRYLRELCPGAKGVQLSEMALMFFKENQEQVLKNQNVEKILFVPSGLDPAWLAEHGLPRNLPARTREVFAGRGELSANLQVLQAEPYRSMPLTGLSVLQSPQDASEPFAQTLESARLALMAPRRDVPALLAATAERCKTFGAACDINDADGLVGQDPLWNLDFTPFAGKGSNTDAGVDAGAGMGSLGDVGSGAAIRAVSVEGLFRAAAPLRFSSDADGLVVEGRSSELTLETGAAFIPEPGRVYSLWLELGRRRTGLSAVTAEAWGGGKSVRVPVKPGFPVVFPPLPGRVEGVRLHLRFDGPEFAVSLRQAVLQSTPEVPARQNLFTARYLFEEAFPLAAAAQSPGRLLLSGPAAGTPQPSGQGFASQWLLLDLSTCVWSANDPAPVVDAAMGGAQFSIPLTSPSGRVAVYLPGLGGTHIGAGLSSGGGAASGLTLTLRGGAPGADLTCSRAVISGQRLASWPDILATGPLVELGGRAMTLSTLDPAQAERMAATNSWRMLGQVELPAGAPPVRFFRSPWLEVEALLLADASGPELSSLAIQAGAGGQAASSAPVGKPGHSGKWLALAAVLALAACGWLLLRGGRGASFLDAAEAWLCRERGRDGRPLPLAPWMAAALALALGGFFLGMAQARQSLMFSAFLAIPVWRAMKPRLLFLPHRLANAPVLYYCLGFLLAAGLGALLRLTGLPAVSELFGLMGLGLFFAAIFLHLRSIIGSDTCAGSSNRTF